MLNLLLVRVQACRMVPTQTSSSRHHAPGGRFNKRGIAGASKDPQVRGPVDEQLPEVWGGADPPEDGIDPNGLSSSRARGVIRVRPRGS